MIFGNLVGEFYVKVGVTVKAVASVKISPSLWSLLWGDGNEEFLLYGESSFFVFTSRKLLPSRGFR
jgi:hypothetical protein